MAAEAAADRVEYSKQGLLKYNEILVTNQKMWIISKIRFPLIISAFVF